MALSFLGGEVAFAPWVLPRSEIELTGSCGYDTATFTRVIELINAGAFRAEAWVEHVGLDEVVPAFEDLQAGRRLKVLVDLS